MKKSIVATSLTLLALSFFQCKCDDDSSNDCVCIEIYAPVCGDDGIVYDNSCYAECAGVTYTDGFCVETRDGFVRNLGDPAVDGCGWVIELLFSDVIVGYRPDKLAEEFKVDGLEVTVEYKQTLEQSPCGKLQTIPVIKIFSIQEK